MGRCAGADRGDVFWHQDTQAGQSVVRYYGQHDGTWRVAEAVDTEVINAEGEEHRACGTPGCRSGLMIGCSAYVDIYASTMRARTCGFPVWRHWPIEIVDSHRPGKRVLRPN